MILVLLGTNPYPFTRLLDAVLSWRRENDEQVVIQSGTTPVDDESVDAQPYIEHERLLKYIADADVVVTQGGFGSLQDCMKCKARTVAVPRLIDQGESVDDQKEIVDILAEEGRVVAVYDIDLLPAAIEQAMNSDTPESEPRELAEHVSMTINTYLGR